MSSPKIKQALEVIFSPPFMLGCAINILINNNNGEISIKVLPACLDIDSKIQTSSFELNESECVGFDKLCSEFDFANSQAAQDYAFDGCSVSFQLNSGDNFRKKSINSLNKNDSEYQIVELILNILSAKLTPTKETEYADIKRYLLNLREFFDK